MKKRTLITAGKYAALSGITVQAVYLRAKLKKIKVEKINGQSYIDVTDQRVQKKQSAGRPRGKETITL